MIGDSEMKRCGVVVVDNAMVVTMMAERRQTNAGKIEGLMNTKLDGLGRWVPV